MQTLKQLRSEYVPEIVLVSIVESVVVYDVLYKTDLEILKVILEQVYKMEMKTSGSNIEINCAVKMMYVLEVVLSKILNYYLQRFLKCKQ